MTVEAAQARAERILKSTTVHEALDNLVDAIEHDGAGFCPTCGHSPPSSNVELALAQLTKLVRDDG